MKIRTTRRISQIFFFLLFLWFGIVATIGIKWWQLRGWPIDLFLYLDPLTAIGTLLTTHTLYKPLLWALVTIVLTIVFGRFFCGWLCPFGSIHHFIGFLGQRSKTNRERIDVNRYRKFQNLKYYILLILIISGVLPSSLALFQTGLLDPIPLVTRTLNLVLLPIADRPIHLTAPDARFYEGAWLIFSIFFISVALNLVVPRFYCRFICPLGAFFGLISRYSLWRIGKGQGKCKNDHMCATACEGGCEPSKKIKANECVLCFNCLEACADGVITYQTKPSASGETINPDISRRGFVLSMAGGVLLAPAVRLSNNVGANWYYKLIRPPGALAEEQFLARCIKCGQCMRICPTNVIQPGGLEGGFENLWTPVLNNRIGISGCQYNCVACGQVCPTAAIRPITLEEKHGTGPHRQMGRIKIGTAFIDRNRCLPWTMNKPCIVCQENCPLSPKAIHTDETFETVRDGVFRVKSVTGKRIETRETNPYANNLSTGDFFCTTFSTTSDEERIRIQSYSNNTITLVSHLISPVQMTEVKIQVRLQRPFVDIEKCNGCGICEHECPVSGKRAIQVSGEGETRDRRKTLLLPLT